MNLMNHEHLPPIQYTLWSFNIAIENTPVIVGFPIKNGEFP